MCRFAGLNIGFSWETTIKILNIMPTDSISRKKHEDTDLISIYSADENIWHNDNVFFCCFPNVNTVFG